MRYLSVCAGIEAATVAWHPLGWQAAGFSEIDPFARAVLEHRYPGVPLHGDFTTIKGNEYGTIDLLVGGTPCQSFSIAGLRKGFDDDRGNLALEFIRLAQKSRARWLVWENVPGVLSIDGGRAFGAFLGGLAECGYGFAYRILDAQYFGVPQRRRRVFVVGYLGDWRPAAAVLFEREGLRGDITPRREARQGAAGTIGARTCRSIGAQDADCGHLVAKTLMAASNKQDPEVENYVVDRPVIAKLGHTKSNGCGISEDGNAYTLEATNSSNQAVFFESNMSFEQPSLDVSATLKRKTHASVLTKSQIRRLTPIECERLQGFPDDYTLVPYRGKPAADAPRYKALGNSMAVPVMRWIGERIVKQEAI